jgi:hypothetical protein
MRVIPFLSLITSHSLIFLETKIGAQAQIVFHQGQVCQLEPGLSCPQEIQQIRREFKIAPSAYFFGIFQRSQQFNYYCYYCYYYYYYYQNLQSTQGKGTTRQQ